MSPSFQFVQQAARVQYQTDGLVPSSVLAAAGRREGVQALNINHMISDNETTVLQSPTSSTVVEIKTSASSLVTHYFGTLASEESYDERKHYCETKLRALFSLLDAVSVKPLYFEITTIAHMSSEGMEPKNLRDAALAALSLPQFMSESHPVYDFSFRVANTVTPLGSDLPTVFSNLSLSWYQTRMYRGPAKQEISIWDMQLAEEGLEFKYDRNNKCGLMNGRRDWTYDDFVSIASGGLTDMREALSGVQEAIAGRL